MLRVDCVRTVGACVAVVAALFSQPAFATTGNEWMASRKGGDFEQGMAYGIVDAVVSLRSGFGWDAFIEEMARKGSSKPQPKLPRFCLPDGVTREQTVAVALKWMRANPEQTNQSAPVLIERALIEAWPCATNEAK